MSVLIRKAEPWELEKYLQLQQLVHEAMEQKDWFYLDTPEESKAWMDSGRMELWLALDDDRVAGGFDLLIPGLAPENYGYALGFSREELLRVVNMDSAAVHPDYRGQGIQRRLLQAAEEWLGTEENRILLCTVHPDNRFSLQNALAQGYAVEKELPIYGSTRYLLRKDIRKNKK